MRYIDNLYNNLDKFLFKNKLEIVELASSKSGSKEKIADIIIENIEIGILNIKDACMDANIPIAQWVLPRINPPKYNELIYSENIRIYYFCQNNRRNVF